MIRALDVVRVALGAADLRMTAAHLELGRDPGRRERTVFRVLGIRQLVQAAASAALPVRHLGIAVDVVHSISMAGVGLVGPRRFRRAARREALLAAALAGWGSLSARRG